MFPLLFFLFVFSSSFAVELEITKQYEEDLIQRVQNVYVNKTPIYPLPKCGTSVMLELNMVKDKLSPETRELLKPYLSRHNYFPYIEYTYNTLGGHFKIHYAKSGPDSVYKASQDINSNGVPDYVDRCAEALDYVWAKEVDTMGYNQPPSDGSAGGDSRYDVYIVNLGYGYLGVTYSQSPTTPVWSYTSYIELANYYTGYGYPDQYDLMHVTVGHEFFHSIQFGYDIYEGYDPYPNWNPYWMEMSSTWMEDQTYDNVNDYVGYLSNFFDYPWLSLKTFGDENAVVMLHCYASCVFPIYLSEKFGVGVMKNIWTECGRVEYNNTFAAIDTALKPFGADFDSAFKEFLVWNLFTGSRAEPSKYYSEGSSYPEINVLNQQKYSAYPVNVTSVDSMPENLASNYVRFTPLVGPGGLAMTFDGASIAQWVVPIVGYKSSGAHLISAFDLNAQQEGSFDFYNWDDYNYIYMIAGVLTKDSSKYNYGYADTFKVGLGVDQDNLPDRGEYALAQNYPNPFNSQTTLHYNLKEDGIVNISIYNILGQKIRELCNNFQRIGANRISWDGKDDQNRDLSSGIYFYKIKTKNFELTKRMVLLK
jgi:hypothetical protein